MSHGRHIAAIILGSINLIAPDLIASGFFGIVAPPYYEIKPARDTKKSMFVRDQEDIVQWNASVLYEPYFNIEIASLVDSATPKMLTGREYASFAEIVHSLGISIDNLAEELSINPLLLEGLTRCTGYLYPHTMNEEAIRAELGADRVVYIKEEHTIVVTIGSDEVVPLHQLPERIIAELLPTLRMIRWNLWIPLITTKKTPEYRQEALSLYQLYLLFQKANTLTSVSPIKGIGAMEPEESYRACVDPRYRKAYIVHSVGDVNIITALLGAGSDARKQLKEAAHVSDRMFV